MRALEQDTADRAALIERECSGDAALAAQVGRLLDADARLAGHTARAPLADVTRLRDLVGDGGAQAGQRLGAYRLGDEIGSGGMGRVFRAERDDGQFVHAVAVKFLRRELVDAHTLARFRLERQVLATLNHPGIARLLDANELDDGTPYYVMEFVPGEPITHYGDRLGLGIAARLEVFLRVCEAVEHAHGRLVVHRDIKPGNILVDEEGRPKLLDFGIAKVIGQSAGLERGEETATAHRFFSPATAAPEQLRGGAVTVGCDVYALGNLLYELLCGRKPFDVAGLSAGQIEHCLLHVTPPTPSGTLHSPSVVPGEVDELMHRVRARGATSASQLARTLRGDLDAIAMRCLRKVPEERYRSVEQISRDVRAYLAGRPVGARDGQRAYQIRKFVGRHRWAVAGAATILLAIVAAGAGFGWQARRIAVERDHADAARRAAEQQRDRAQHVTDFLVGAFRSADPANSLGVEVTARQIVDQGAARLRSELADAPELRAELLTTLGEVNFNLGRRREAGDLIGQALHTLDAAAVTNAPLRARATAWQGRAAVATASPEQARPALLAALALDPPAPLRASIGLDLARLDRDSGAYDAALLQIDAVTAAMNDGAAMTSARVEAHQLRAEVLALAGRRDDGRAELERLLDLQRTWQPDAHPDLLRTRLQLAEALRVTGEPARATQMIASLLPDARRLYGSDTPAFAAVLNYDGNALADLGRSADAIARYREAFEIWQRSLGERHPTVARAAFNLAGASDDANRWDDAQHWYRRCIELAAAIWPPEHPTRALFVHVYAESLEKHQRDGDALALLQPVVEARIAERDALNMRDLHSLVRLARLERRLGRVEAARAHLRQLYELLKYHEMLDHPEFAPTLAHADFPRDAIVSAGATVPAAASSPPRR